MTPACTASTAEVVADESLEYMYYPLAFFDSYQGWDWFAE